MDTTTPFIVEGASILLVDDQEMIGALVCQVLISEGFLVTFAQTGGRALELLRAQKFDLVLLDINLPDINGMVLFDWIKSQDGLSSLPVIFLTGEADASQKVRAFNAGAVDYIVKPFKNSELIARLTLHLRNRAALDQRQEMATQIALDAKASVKAAEQRFKAFVSNSLDLVCELDSSLRVVYFSPNHHDILLYNPSQLRSAWWPEFVHPDDVSDVVDAFKRILRTQADGRVSLRFRAQGGAWWWLDTSGSVFLTQEGEPRLLLVSRDVTGSKKTEARLQHLSLHDTLTELGNRQYFSNQLETIIKDPETLSRHAIVCLDVDNFKLVNDTQGHPAGDLVLQTVASMLRTVLGKNCTPCRLGGDEFAILMSDVDAAAAQSDAERLIAACRDRPIGLAGNRLGITLSAGVAMFEPNASAEEVLARADSALQMAKSSGKNCCRLFCSDNEELLELRSSAVWYQRIVEGLESSKFELWYQPVERLNDRALFCYEALLRYRGSDDKIHSPNKFIPVAERYGLMSKVDRYVVLRAFVDLVRHSELRVSINLSGDSISDPTMSAFIREAFEKFSIDPHRVIFEITETIFITNLGSAQKLVEELQEFGCLFALDDFGSGFSSLKYLRELPVNIVKIDGTFIQQIGSDPVHFALLKSINEIAHLLGKTTVAEFVESEDSMALLTEIGVDYVQGFYIGRPHPLAE